MGAIKSYIKSEQKGPSTFALPVDDISKMSASQQKFAMDSTL